MHHEQSADDSDPRPHSHRPRWRRTAWRQRGTPRRLRARGHVCRSSPMDPLMVPFVGDATEASLMASLGDCLLDVSPRARYLDGPGSAHVRGRVHASLVGPRWARSVVGQLDPQAWHSSTGALVGSVACREGTRIIRQTSGTIRVTGTAQALMVQGKLVSKPPFSFRATSLPMSRSPSRPKAISETFWRI